MNGEHVAQVIRDFWIQLIQVEMMDFHRCNLLLNHLSHSNSENRGRDDTRKLTIDFQNTLIFASAVLKC